MTKQHAVLKENALIAVSKLFRDTSVDPQKTRESLEELDELIKDYLNTLKN